MPATSRLTPCSSCSVSPRDTTPYKRSELNPGPPLIAEEISPRTSNDGAVEGSNAACAPRIAGMSRGCSRLPFGNTLVTATLCVEPVNLSLKSVCVSLVFFFNFFLISPKAYSRCSTERGERCHRRYPPRSSARRAASLPGESMRRQMSVSFELKKASTCHHPFTSSIVCPEGSCSARPNFHALISPLLSWDGHSFGKSEASEEGVRDMRSSQPEPRRDAKPGARHLDSAIVVHADQREREKRREASRLAKRFDHRAIEQPHRVARQACALAHAAERRECPPAVRVFMTATRCSQNTKFATC